MTTTIILSILLIVAIAGGLATIFKTSRASAREHAGRLVAEESAVAEQNAHRAAEEALAAERSARTSAEQALGALKVEYARLEERFQQSTAQHERLERESEERFRSLANKVLMESASNLQRQNSVGIAEALRPVKENFELFRQTFSDRTERDAAERMAFSERIRDLMELNATVSRETRRLTDALKGNSKAQGDWGEMILQTILEHCGLQEGREFVTQTTFTDADGGRLRPDVVINYTDGRKIVVDSKVSIQSYLHMVECDSEESRRSFAKEHVVSVRKHIAELRGKNYQALVGKAQVEFVLMFIPHEGAYLSAMQLGGDDLWQTAYASNVLIVSPTHLMGVVRLVEQMWRHDRQDRNAQEIARQAGAMLDKLRGFLEDMDRIDKSLNDARSSWNDAFSKLTTGNGNLISRAKRLGELGAKAKKALPARYLPEEDSDEVAENDR